MRYLHLDVFTSSPFEGNQLAVCPQPAAGLTTERMQAIAGEMAFSETTFVFPREQAGDVKMRIFTPWQELPMAGHPTIGTTYALALEGVIARGRKHFVFECGVGPIPVELEWDDRGLSFVWMTQLLPSFERQFAARERLAAAIGLDPEDLADLPVEIVSCGVPFLFVPVRTRTAVDRIAINTAAAAAVFRDAASDPLPMFFFTTDRAGATSAETVYSRMLAPEFGITEDPATGGASGPLGCYLLHHGVVSADQAEAMVSLQGVAMKRPSRIHISIESRGGTISRVRIGGQAVAVAEGRLLV